MQEKTYLVGEVSKITGVSKDTLRFWDRIGLLKPKLVNPENGYRCYTYDQFWRIDIISCCRSLNIPTEKIRSILASSSNGKVLELLLEQQRKAESLSQYYRQVAEDIAWYMDQDRQIQKARQETAVTVKYIPERPVLYGSNAEETQAYHLKLQELCNTAMDRTPSIRRGYGFILHEEAMARGAFVKRGEYLRLEPEVLRSVDPDKLTLLPAGNYACCILRVARERADFSPLLDWLRREGRTPRYVLADEIGLQLFEYLDHGYLCEVKVLLS